jgi:hypothetical protein
MTKWSTENLSTHKKFLFCGLLGQSCLLYVSGKIVLKVLKFSVSTI